MSTSNTAQDPQDIERAIERLGSQDDFRSHTHRPLHKIIEQQGIGPIERVLLWLAKTDLYVLNVVPNNCRGTLVSLGMMAPSGGASSTPSGPSGTATRSGS